MDGLRKRKTLPYGAEPAANDAVHVSDVTTAAQALVTDSVTMAPRAWTDWGDF
jgi:hypothetical protein